MIPVMRERTTWNRDVIAKGHKSAATPLDLVPEHVQQQKPADAYTTGGPSEFAEDVAPSAPRWKAEYEGGEVARNEIGMPEMRDDTVNHPTKSPGSSKAAFDLDPETVAKKANLCVKVARKMLFKGASEQVIEDQAYSLMHLPDAELLETARRLAAAQDDEEEEEDADEGQKQAKDSGQVPPQFLEHMKGKDKDDDKKDDAKDDKKDEGKKEASDLAQMAASAIQAGDQQALQAAIQQMVQGMLQQQARDAQQQMQQAQQGQPQQQMAQDQQMQAQGQQQQMAQGQQQQMAQGQQMLSQQQMQAMIQDMVQQACQQMAQGQPQQQMAQGQQQPMAQQGQPMANDDDMLLDQMLQDESGQVMANASNNDIQIDGPQMDVGASELPLGQDDVLNSLFASNQEYQNAVEAHQITTGMPVQASAPAGMARTASTRTVGTRPTGGVSHLGGASSKDAGGGNEINKLSNMWASAPDVRKHFA